MSDRSVLGPSAHGVEVPGDLGRRRAEYRSPQLVVLGDIRSLTMGASAGSTDSGGLGQEPGGVGPAFGPTPPAGYSGEWPGEPGQP